VLADALAIRYLNVHEAQGSISLAVCREAIDSVQVVRIPLSDLRVSVGDDLVLGLEATQARLKQLAEEPRPAPRTALERLQAKTAVRRPHDTDVQNQGGLGMRPGEGVDVADADGNVRVGWMRGGEWLTYDVVVPRTRTYAVAARVSILNTTDHNKEELQPSGVSQRLTAGRHIIRVSLPADAFQNWNLDYLQLTPVGH
jgi:hypothetical protein